MPDRQVIVMVKEPRAGRVKTRLGRDIGMTGAAWWFRHQVAGLLRDIRDPRWRIVLAVTPDHAATTGRAWPRDLSRIPQGRGDLGARMARALRRAPGPTLLVGADIPGITPRHLWRAFRCLGAADSVLGPATDGGYWLIGVRHGSVLPARALADVRWSGPHALADTISTLGKARIAFADTLRDVDRAADLAPDIRAQ